MDSVLMQAAQDVADILKARKQTLAVAESSSGGLISAALLAVGAKGMADMGKVMAVLKPQLAGRADIGKVSALVKAKLAG